MKILLSGSGSGGHIYPCIALYNNLKKDNDIIVIIFKEIDKKIYDRNNIKYEYIDDNLSTLKKILLIKNIIRKNNIEKSITFGGKNSIYINLTCKFIGIDNYIFEQNAIMGKANKVNALLCKNIFTNFKLNKKKEINVGNPNAYEISKHETKIFNNGKITILITMGSLGSSSVNKVIKEFITTNDKYNFIYVTGNNVKIDKINKSNIKIYDYYEPLTTLINASDIIISRAGASTLSEIIALAKPSIIIPSPYVANDHQYKNAILLKNNNACLMIEEKDLTIKKLNSYILTLTINSNNYENIKQNLKKLQHNNEFNKIRDIVLNDNI